MHMPMPFTCLVTAVVQLAQGRCLPGLPRLDMYRSAYHLGPAGQLRQQPVRWYPAVGIGARQPLRAALDHVRCANPAGHTDVAGIHRQYRYTEASCHGGAAVAAAVQHHQHLHLVSRLLRLLGRGQYCPQAAPKAPGLVVGRDHHGNHGQVSSRSTTLGWVDQYSSTKSASSCCNCRCSGRCRASMRCTSRPSCGQPAMGCFQWHASSPPS
ncbi:hypothetical protein D3C76_1137810 [compost metagenome]